MEEWTEIWYAAQSVVELLEDCCLPGRILGSLGPACLRFQSVELVSGTGPLTVVLLYVPII